MQLAPDYAKTMRLSGGKAVDLRPMTGDDAAAVLSFAQSLGDEDVLFLRSDITTPEGVAYWVANIEQGTTASILAEVGKEIAGYASIHRNPARWTRRVGEIRVNVASRFRGEGLGRILVGEAFDLARSLGLKKLSAQMTVDQRAAQKAFRHLGFQVEAILADWVEDRTGRPHDLLIMAYDLDGLTDMADEPLTI
jgi:RimJ/RimL family protein N-acetyltransferase